MFELIYPSEPAPVLGAGKSAAAAGKSCTVLCGAGADDGNAGHRGRTEMFPVVEPTGLVSGQASREYCHGGTMVLHPVVHLHIIDRYGRLYLQKRSMKKDIQPGKWDTAVGGHVAYGEMLVEALYREASEELGLRDFNPVYICSYVFQSDVEKELVNVFATVGSFDLRPDHDEVDEGRFWNMEEIGKSLGKSVLTPNFEGEFAGIRDKLLALL